MLILKAIEIINSWERQVDRYVLPGWKNTLKHHVISEKSLQSNLSSESLFSRAVSDSVKLRGKMGCVAALVLYMKPVLFLLLNLLRVHVGAFCTDFQAFLFIIKPKDVLLCGEQVLESLNLPKGMKCYFLPKFVTVYSGWLLSFLLLTGYKIWKQYK